MNEKDPLFIFFIIGAVILMGILIPGIGLWMICGCPDLSLKYVRRIIFTWPLLLLSRTYYEHYMRERSVELEDAWRPRESEEARQTKEWWEKNK